MTELQYISDLTNAKPNECSCNKCAEMCLRAPCLGTPNDILKIINNGLGEHLQESIWATGMIFFGHPTLIEMVQLEHTNKGCCMYENGKCKLHNTGLKPTEGVLATCNPILEIQHVAQLSLIVAKEWESPRNDKAIRIIDKYMNTFHKK